MGDRSAWTDGTAKQRALVDVRAFCERCAQSFRKDRPFHHQITARLLMLRIFLITPGNPELMTKPFDELNALEKSVKLLSALIFLCTVVPGVIWGLRSFFHPRSSIGLRLVAALMLYGVFIFPSAMRMTETRYLTTVYPFAVMFTVLMGTRVWAPCASAPSPLDRASGVSRPSGHTFQTACTGPRFRNRKMIPRARITPNISNSGNIITRYRHSGTRKTMG